MALELKGKIIHVLPEQTGTSQRGPWRKQEYVIEIPGDYPKQVCFMVWGEKIEEFNIQQGQELIVHIDLQSRDYNGRWYTDVKAWRVEPAKSGEGQGDVNGFGRGNDPGNGPVVEPREKTPSDFDDDIPF